MICVARICMRHANEARHVYEWDMVHVWMIHVTRMNASCHTFESVMSHVEWVQMEIERHNPAAFWRHVTLMNESRYTCDSVMSRIWIRHVTHIKLSCHTCECIHMEIERHGPAVSSRHVFHVNESRHIYEFVMSHVWIRRITPMNESCHTHECIETENERYEQAAV